jgi:hypothetical protein
MKIFKNYRFNICLDNSWLLVCHFKFAIKQNYMLYKVINSKIISRLNCKPSFSLKNENTILRNSIRSTYVTHKKKFISHSPKFIAHIPL